jgi:hypothetical protein
MADPVASIRVRRVFSNDRCEVCCQFDLGDGGQRFHQRCQFDDLAASYLPQAQGSGCPSGRFKPTNYAINPCCESEPDLFPAPAPAGPYATTLSTFNGWYVYTSRAADPC